MLLDRRAELLLLYSGKQWRLETQPTFPTFTWIIASSLPTLILEDIIIITTTFPLISLSTELAIKKANIPFIQPSFIFIHSLIGSCQVLLNYLLVIFSSIKTNNSSFHLDNSIAFLVTRSNSTLGWVSEILPFSAISSIYLSFSNRKPPSSEVKHVLPNVSNYQKSNHHTP